MRLPTLIKDARACTECRDHLPLGPRPLFQLSKKATILIIGQAPGTAAHASGIPWDDPSGRRLRGWLGISDAAFYDADHIALMPMGFCYPGKGKSGDLPPRPECAPRWHGQMLAAMPAIALTIYIGRYAIDHYLPGRYKTITAAAQDHAALLPKQIVLPHPSPRNNIWLKKNPWFEEDVLPRLKRRISNVLSPHQSR